MARPRSSFALALRALAAAASFAAAPALAAPAFTPENQPIGYLAQPRSTSLDVRKGTEVAYYGDYERQFWSGNLKPFNIAPQGQLNVESDLWPGGAAPVLNQQVATVGKVIGWQDKRKVVTLKSDNGNRVAFFRSNLHSSQQAWVTDKQVAYVRGDRSNEAPNGDKLRIRRYVLGDIIRSRPAYVGGTVPMIYVGANDGMLHAFNANTGEEVYAYIPSMLIPKLANLAPPESAGYVHTHFVDASPRAAQVTIGGATRRILVGGLGAGGRGLYALDITPDSSASPTAESSSSCPSLPTTSSAASCRILWEITPDRVINASASSSRVTTTNAYRNLGHTYGEPIIGKSNDGGNDVIFMPNGYMNTLVAPAVPGVTNAGDGKASLFVINPATGALIREIQTNAGSASSPNGLSSPTPVDTNGDGRIDLLYAGDLDGNLWKFDVSASTPSSWSVSLLFATSPAQSITTAPAVADHPLGGRIVAFGTGRVLMEADMTDDSVHYMYGIWDGAPSSATALLEQSLIPAPTAAQPHPYETFVSSSGSAVRRVRSLTMNAPDWSTHRGWRVAMPKGERFVGDRPTLTNARVYANTFNPTVNLSATDAEGNPKAKYENWKYQFNFLTGGGSTSTIFDLNLDGSFDDNDLLPNNETGTRPRNERVASGLFQNAGVASQPVVVTTTVGSQDLYTQNADLPALVLGDPGISGGHFDVDIYYPTAVDKGLYKGYVSRKHVHEYDDKYNVTGVNMLNASDPAFNLTKASFAVRQISPHTQFKVLVMNQYHNPAARLRVGPRGATEIPYVPVKDFQGQAQATSAATLWSSLPTYIYDPAGTTTPPAGVQSLGQLVMGLPLDAFQSKTWGWTIGSGSGVRAGLMPTQTGCVKEISDTNFAATPGPQGERHNGALTVQLVRADTPASALEMNVPGKPEYGWRVKSSEYRKHVLALWTYFWHHPNGKCYGQSGWVPDPPQDPTGVTGGTAPPGTDDPQEGDFNAVGNNNDTLSCSGTVTGSTLTTDKATLTTTEVITYSDKCTVTVVIVRDGTGGVEERRTVRLGNGEEQTTVARYRETETWTPNHTRTAAAIGRISWRELVRE